MGEYSISINKVNNVLEQISNVEIENFDSGINKLSSSFMESISSFISYGANKWDGKLKEWEIECCNITYKLKDKKYRNILFSIDKEKLYQAAAKASILMNTFKETEGLAKTSASLFDDLFTIIKLKESEEKLQTNNELRNLSNGFEILEGDEAESEQDFPPQDRDSSSLLIQENNSKSNLFSKISSSIYSWSTYLSGNDLNNRSDLSSQGVGIEEGVKADAEINLMKGQLTQLLANRQQITHEELQLSIIQLLNDATLSKIGKLEASNGVSLECPVQFLHDCNRTNKIKYDETTIFKKGQVAKFVKKKLYPKGLVKNNELIISFLIKKLGQDLFNKVFTILHQSQTADFLQQLGNFFFEDTTKRNSYSIYSTTGLYQEFDIHYDEENNEIRFFVKLMYKGCVAPEGMIPVEIGFFGLRREITFDVDELLNSNDTFPSLVVKEKITDLEPTKKAVAKQLKSAII